MRARAPRYIPLHSRYYSHAVTLVMMTTHWLEDPSVLEEEMPYLEAMIHTEFRRLYPNVPAEVGTISAYEEVR